MRISALLAFWVVTFLLVITPGPDWAFTLAAALRGDTVRSAVGGLVTGYAAMTLVVAAGVGAVVAGSPAALTALTLVGGGYLVWLGAGTLRQPPPPTRPAAEPAPGPTADPTAGPTADPTAGPTADPTAGPTADPVPRTERGTFREGIGVSGLNPKGLLVFVALLPQFVSRQAPWPVALQLAVLGIAFTATCGGFYCALGTFARRVLRARPGTGQALSRISGAVMVVIGVLLVAERLLG